MLMRKILPSIFIALFFLISGCLPTIFTGATVSVVELAKDRSTGETLTDARIATAIKTALLKSNFRKLYTKITVEVVKGRVFYTGLVDKEEDSIRAVQIGWEQKDVVEVVNELKVDKNSDSFNPVQYTRDSMITSQIKSRIFMDRSVKFVNYTVITLNDVVYLFGLARSEEELHKVADVAANVRGVKKVVSHVKVDELASKIRSKDVKSRDNYTQESKNINDYNNDRDDVEDNDEDSW